MPEARFVAGDWGTSHLRLFLCDEDGRVLDDRTGPGAAGVTGGYPKLFDSLLAPWRQQHADLPAVLCGMVGSTIGWAQVPYVACPARPEQIAEGCLQLHEHALHIVPGLSCRNRLGAPDFMRGEETQILGALQLEPALRNGRRLLCLPGTHTKWVALEDGCVTDFLTAPTGELFAILRDHSVLVHRGGTADATRDAAAFTQGLAEFNRLPDAQLLHRLFEGRSRRLAGEMSDPSAAPFLSGLLIASDVHGAFKSFGSSGATEAVHVVGTPQLTALYASALGALRLASHVVDGAAAALAGLVHVHRRLVSMAALHGA